MTTLITAICVSLFIENLFVAKLGAAPRAFPQLLREHSYPLFGNAAISKSQILIFAVSVALMLLLQWVIFKTKVGTAMRAVSFNLYSAKVNEIIKSVLIPINFAELRLKETARIAVPTLVLKITHCSKSISATETAKIRIWDLEMAALPNRE